MDKTKHGNRYTDPVYTKTLGAVKVTPDQAKRLDEHCKRHKISRSDVIRDGIEAVIGKSSGKRATAL